MPPKKKAGKADESSPRTSPGPKRRAGRRGRKNRAKTEEVEEEVPEPEPAGPPPQRPDEELFETVRFQALIDKEDIVGHIYQQIQDGEDINQCNIHGFTPLAIASAAGNAPLVSLLLEKRANEGLGSIGRAESPLHHAANFGHRLVCQLLCEPAFKSGVINMPNSTGWTPLHLTAASGHLPCLRVLLSCKAHVDARNRTSGEETALHAAARGDHETIMETLLAHDANVNSTDSMGRSALHIAAGRANADCVSLLLRNKADPHLSGYGGNSPLDVVPHGHVERDRTVKLLHAYLRPPPKDQRMDTHFERRDSRSLI